MKHLKLFTLAVLTAITITSAFAQMGLAVRLNRKNYMLHEQIFICITMRNDTGKPLLFGNRPELQGFILFDIRDKNNRPVAPRKDREISVSGLYLAPGETKNMVLPLSRYYDLSQPGKYRVHAYVSHNSIQREFRSRDAVFNISEGITVWNQKVGMPDITGSKQNSLPERNYTIKMLEDGGFRSIYLQVEDPSHILAVTKIGNEVSYEKFQAEVDMLSRIHLLMPVAPRVYHYMSFNVDGVNLVNNYWKTTSTIPSLYRDQKSGKVIRIGGDIARKGIDYRDPKSGHLSVSDLTGDTPSAAPQAPESSNMVDLGENVMPQKAADEK